MDSKKKQRILAVVGPTASGKSELGVKLARELGGEIISADSRQVYRGLNVGTGKVTGEEMHGIPHYLLDVADPKERFTASQYRNLGLEALEEILGRGKLPIIVGGTGFYIDALAGMKLPEVPPDPELRERLEEKSAEELMNMLQEKDPERAGRIHTNNKVRIIRALEITEALGKVPPAEQADSPYEFVYIGLLPSDLDRRIQERLEKRMEGMITEAKKLHMEGLSYERMHELGLEYRYIAMYLQGQLSQEEMKAKLYTAIRQYAKRQMTWFKRNRKIKWFEPEEYEEINKYLKENLAGDEGIGHA